MNRRGILFVLVGLVAALAAAVVVYIISMNVTQQSPEQQTLGQPSEPGLAVPTPIVETMDVLVAAQDISPNTLITTTMITSIPYPVRLIPSDVITNTAELVGTTSRTSIIGGLPFVRRQIADLGGRVGASAVIPPGKVLVAFPSTDILNSTGAVQAGDHVDVLLTIPISGTNRLDAGYPAGSQLSGNTSAIVSQATLQNIEVYGTGEWTPPGTDPHISTQTQKIITFLVSHQEALILKYVKDGGGTIDLVVRSLQEGDVVETDPVNIDYLVAVYDFIGLSAQP